MEYRVKRVREIAIGGGGCHSWERGRRPNHGCITRLKFESMFFGGWGGFELTNIFFNSILFTIFDRFC